MHCPEPRCGSKSIGTWESRPRPEDNTVRRRRYCKTCGHRWTTVELIAPDSARGQRIYAGITSGPPDDLPPERVIRIRGDFVIERVPPPPKDP